MPDNKSLNILLTTKYQGKGLDDLKKDFKDNKIELDKLTKSGQQNTDAFKKLQLQQKELDRTIKGLTRQYKGLDAEVKASKFQMLEFGENLTVVSAGLIAAGTAAINFGKQVFKAAQEGADFGIMLESFKKIGGTDLDLQLLKQASAGNLAERELMQYAQQLHQLGRTLPETALLLKAIEKQSDLTSKSFEEGNEAVKKFIATGATRALVGFMDIPKIKDEVDRLTEATGKTTEEITELEKEGIRTQAVLNVYGGTIEDIANDSPDNADKIAAVGNKFKDLEDKAKLSLANALIPFIDKLPELAKQLGITEGAFDRFLKEFFEEGTKYIQSTIKEINALIEVWKNLTNFINTMDAMGLKGKLDWLFSFQGGIGGGDRSPFLNAQFGGGAFGAMNGVRNLFPGKPIQQQQFAGQAVTESFQWGALEENSKMLLDNITSAMQTLGFGTDVFVTKLFSGLSMILNLFETAKTIGGIIGIIGSIFGLATGGQAHEGQPYIIGEQGKELFIPSQSGSVMNNLDLKSLLSSQSNSNTNNVYISSEIDFIKFYKTSKANYSNYMNLKIL